jgi:hypothetical protein
MNISFRAADILSIGTGGSFIPLSRPLVNKNAAQCIERPLRGSCDAATDHLANGRFGPFASIDTKGGNRSFAASARCDFSAVTADI